LLFRVLVGPRVKRALERESRTITSTIHNLPCLWSCAALVPRCWPSAGNPTSTW